MDANRIRKAAEATVKGALPFPEIVQGLLEAGVESYFVDYAALCFTFYSPEGAVVQAPLPLAGLPPIAGTLDGPALRAAILDSQENGQHFQAFSRRAVEAGVQGYFAFLRGRRVTYFGREGDQHTEWFPGAGPHQA